jgi:TP901 family phage tail tape measure protein
MATLAELMVKVGADISDFTRGLKDVQKNIKGLGTSLAGAGAGITSVGATLSAGLTVPLLALGTTAVVVGAKFDAQMSKVQAISGATAGEFSKLREQALKLGQDSKFSATEVAFGMEQLASAGFETGEILDSMSGIIALASSAGIGLAEASEIAGASLNGFGLQAREAGRVADVLAKASAISATNAVDLGEAFKYVATPATMLGWTLEETASAVGILADAGIKGSQAGTTLRAGILRLASPTKEMNTIMKQLGIQFFDSNGKMKSLSGVINELAKGTAGLTDKQKAHVLSTLFGIEAVSGFMALMQAGTEKIDKNTQALQNAKGEAQKMADIMMNNLAGAWENFTGALETLAISFSDILAPALRSATEWLTTLTEKFTALPRGVKVAMIVLSGVLAVLPPLLIVVGLVAQGVGALATVFGMISAPVALVIAAIVAIGVAFGVAYAKLDWFRNSINSAFNFIKTNVVAAVKAFVGYFSTKIAELRSVWNSEGEGLQKAFRTVWSAIERIISFFSKVYVSIIKSNWEDIKRFFDSAFAAISGIIRFWSGIFEGDWKKAWEGLKQALQGYLDTFKNLFKLSFLDEYYQIVKDGMVKLKGSIEEKLQNIKDAFTKKLSEWKDVLTQWFQNLPNVIREKLSEWKTAFMGWFDEQKTNFITKLHEWETAIGDWFSSLPEKIKQHLLQWGEAIKQWTKEQNEENKRQFEEWWTSISEWFSSIPARLSSKLTEWKNSIVTWFTTTKEELVKKLEEWWTSFSNWFTSIPSRISQKLTEWKTSFISWFNDVKENIPSKLEEWWNGMASWFSAIPSRINTALEDWWAAIKNWFTNLPNKPEIKDAGKNMIDKVAEGNKEKKKDLMDKLGKIIVDVALGALAFAGVALVATGRELIKRLIEGVSSSWESFKQTGRDALQKFIDGVSGMIESLKTKASEAKDAFLQPLKDLKEDVESLIEKIKSAFSGMKISIPTPKLPKINVGSKTLFAGEGGLPPIKIPTFSVSWNAKGAIFNQASILGGGQGVGERGAEAVIPIQHKRYMAPFARAVAENMDSMKKSSDGTVVVENVIHTTIELDGAVVGRKVERYVTQEQTKRQQRTQTGLKGGR